MSTSPWVVAALMLLAALFETSSQTLFKSALNGVEMPTVTLRTMVGLALRLLRSLRIWMGMWIGLATLGVWTWALSKADLNLVFGLASIHYILIPASGRFLLGERIGPWHAVGVILIAAGVAIIGFTGG